MGILHMRLSILRGRPAPSAGVGHARGTRTRDRRSSDQPAARFEALEGRTLMSLTPVGGPVPLNTPGVFDFQADVAMDADGDAVAAWFHVSEDFSDGWPVVRLFDPQGNPKGP